MSTVRSFIVECWTFVFFVHSIILLYGQNISSPVCGWDWTAAPLPGPASTHSSSHHWLDTCLGRFTGTARLCPGKMALEEQCSAPPRWRSISLTHVEFPEGTYSRHFSETTETPLTAGRFVIFEQCVCLLATEWTRPLVPLPNCETLSNLEHSGECNPGCEIVRLRRMRSRPPCPQWRLASMLAVLISALICPLRNKRTCRDLCELFDKIH